VDLGRRPDSRDTLDWIRPHANAEGRLPRQPPYVCVPYLSERFTWRCLARLPETAEDQRG